jgi:outer membrane protein assembly factor BamB
MSHFRFATFALCAVAGCNGVLGIPPEHSAPNGDASSQAGMGADASTEPPQGAPDGSSLSGDGAPTDAIADGQGVSDARSEGGIAAGGPSAVWTGGYDNRRTGATTVETALTQESVRSHFGYLFSRMLDGTVSAQPLYVPQLMVGDRRANVLFVVTEGNSVYAFDAETPGPPLWVKALGNPLGVVFVPAPPPDGGRTCYGAFGQTGVVSTPVIDLASGTLYVVAEIQTDGPHIVLHALDITNGSERPGSPVDIQLPGVNLLNHTLLLQLPGLLLEGGVLYIAFADWCAPDAHGWVVAFDEKTLAFAGVFATTGSAGGGAIAQGGMGLSTDGHGVFFASQRGNPGPGGVVGGLGEYGSSIGRLVLAGQGLSLDESWTAPPPPSGPDTSPPHLTTAVVVTAEDLGFVADSDDSIDVFDAKSGTLIQSVTFAGDTRPEYAGNPLDSFAYWQGPSGGQLFLWPRGGTMQAFGADPGKGLTSAPILAIPQGRLPLPTLGSARISVSSNGTRLGTGVVWALATQMLPMIARNGMAVPQGYSSGIYAFGADDLAPLWSDTIPGSFDPFMLLSAPLVANGRVYFGLGTTLYAYGLR